MKRVAFIFVMLFVCLSFLAAENSGSHELVMSSSVPAGSGTVDSIENVPGVQVNGIQLYLGYLEGPYDPSVTIAQCKPLNNGTAPAELALVKEDEGSSLEDVVTIYVAADSNVTAVTAVEIRFVTGDGWTRVGDAGSTRATVDIVSTLGAANLTYNESNVLAAVDDQSMIMTARRGGPVGDRAVVVGYNELTWPNDGKIASGTYTATVSVEVVTGE